MLLGNRFPGLIPLGRSESRTLCNYEDYEGVEFPFICQGPGSLGIEATLWVCTIGYVYIKDRLSPKILGEEGQESMVLSPYLHTYTY